MAATDVSTTARDLVEDNLNPAFAITNPGSAADRTRISEAWEQARGHADAAFSAAQLFLDALEGNGTVLSVPPTDTALAALETTLSALMRAAPTYAPALVTADNGAYVAPAQLTLLIGQLERWTRGDFTGLAMAIEQAIWRRGTAVDVEKQRTSRREIFRLAAVRGFPRPPGVVHVQLQESARDAQRNAAALSLDVATKQADLLQSNRHFAFGAAWQIQAALMNYLRDQMARVLDAAKATASADMQANAADIQAVSALATYHGRYAEAEASVQRAEVDVSIAGANLRVEDARARAIAVVQRLSVEAEKLRAAAQIAASLAASALSAVNLSASTNQTVAVSANDSRTRSESVSASISGSSNIQENYTP